MELQEQTESIPCILDDTFDFLKSGRVIRKDAETVCNPTRAALPEGTDWSFWGLNANGTLAFRDFDPFYFDNGNIDTEPGSGVAFVDEALVSITEDEIIITYYDGSGAQLNLVPQ